MVIRKLIKTFLTVFIAIEAFIGCDGGFDTSGFEIFGCDGKVVCGVCAPKNATCCHPASYDLYEFPLIFSGSRPVCCQRKRHVALGQLDMIGATIPTLAEFSHHYLKHGRDVIRKRSWSRKVYVVRNH